MQTDVPLTVIEAFARVMATDPNRPLITYYDDATGERTELSGATLGNWVAKTANLLVDGLGLGAGDVALVRLPPHWQTAAVLLGCWWAGLRVDADATVPGAHTSVAFTTEAGVPQSLGAADEVLALALAPMALPFRPAPPMGAGDYVVEARPHGDRFTGPRPAPGAAAFADGSTHADLVVRARQHPVPAGARVLIDGDATTDPLGWLVAPLLAGASVVLCRNLDPARVTARLAAEHATELQR